MNLKPTLHSHTHPDKVFLGFRSKKRKLRNTKSGGVCLSQRTCIPAGRKKPSK